MPLSNNAFSHFTLGEVATLKAAYKQVLLDIASGGQSYTMGRTFTRADLRSVNDTLRQLGDAEAYLSGAGVNRAQAVVRSRR